MFKYSLLAPMNRHAHSLSCVYPISGTTTLENESVLWKTNFYKEKWQIWSVIGKRKRRIKVVKTQLISRLEYFLFLLLFSFYSRVPCQYPLSLKLNKFTLICRMCISFKNIKHFLSTVSLRSAFDWSSKWITVNMHYYILSSAWLYCFHHVNILQPLFPFSFSPNFSSTTLTLHMDKFLFFPCFCLCTQFLCHQSPHVTFKECLNLFRYVKTVPFKVRVYSKITVFFLFFHEILHAIL